VNTPCPTERAYREAVCALRQSCFSEAPEKAYSGIERAKISGALYHLLPSMAVEEHPELLRRIYFNQRQAVLDQSYLSLLVDRLGPVDTVVSTQAVQQAVFGSFHLGAYRLLVPWLLSQGLKVSLLVDRHVADLQRDVFVELLHAFCHTRGIPADHVRIRDTASARVLLRLLKDTREGYSPFIFVDGNTSADAGDSQANTREAGFMAGRLRLRQGAAALAHLAGLPLQPIWTRRRALGDCVNHLHLAPPISPVGQARQAFTENATAQLWQLLGAEVAGTPEQWECWRYVHRSMCLTEPGPAQVVPAELRDAAQQLCFDARRYAIADDTDRPVLFDRADFRAFFVSEEFARLLRGLEQPRPVGALLDQPGVRRETLQRLLQLGVLCAAAV
jgi:hypothetical protein